MSEIKFVTKGYKIPLVLEVEVDGISVTYSEHCNGGRIGFTAWTADWKRAFDAVKKIVDEIIRERSDYKHGVSWRTDRLVVIDTADRYGYTQIEWDYYVRDSG